ncbi:hypothetical protein [Mycoplasma ovis]|uniref:hypothetical protein n=1 Tax=Mycoplasma ovis TaxID=171632 RepID=UPI001183DFC5|nr:hypothetical protein [Mycoplasma ovis]
MWVEQSVQQLPQDSSSQLEQQLAVFEQQQWWWWWWFAQQPEEQQELPQWQWLIHLQLQQPDICLNYKK